MGKGHKFVVIRENRVIKVNESCAKSITVTTKYLTSKSLAQPQDEAALTVSFAACSRKAYF